MPVLWGLDLAVPDGAVTVLVGRNGCGKSTLLKAMARVLPAWSGQVILSGRPVHRMPTRAVAREMALLPQGPVAPEGLIVAELVAQGRFPHQSLLRQWSREDARAVAGAMEVAGVTELADRAVAELSGGQRQRCWVAMTLAQETEVVLLDEPTTFLDLRVQVEVMGLLHRIAHGGRTLVVAMHELNLAAAFADRLVMMREGRIEAAGPVAEVFTEANLARVFGLDAAVLRDPGTGRPVCVPRLPRAARDAEPDAEDAAGRVERGPAPPDTVRAAGPTGIVPQGFARRDPAMTAAVARPGTAALGTGTLLALGALALAFAWHVSVGAKTIPLGVVAEALLAYDPQVFDHVVIRDLRLPRAAIAVAVGAALSVAGALMQGVTRNPLAELGLLGLFAGASFAVVVGHGLLGLGGPAMIPALAAVGALGGAAAVWGIASAAPGGLRRSRWCSRGRRCRRSWGRWSRSCTSSTRTASGPCASGSRARWQDGARTWRCGRCPGRWAAWQWPSRWRTRSPRSRWETRPPRGSASTWRG